MIEFSIIYTPWGFIRKSPNKYIPEMLWVFSVIYFSYSVFWMKHFGWYRCHSIKCHNLGNSNNKTILNITSYLHFILHKLYFSVYYGCWWRSESLLYSSGNKNFPYTWNTKLYKKKPFYMKKEKKLHSSFRVNKHIFN